MGVLNRYQMSRTFSHWKGLTKKNHLGSIFALNQQKATNVMVQLLAYQRGKSLDNFLSQFPVKEFDEGSPMTWDVISSSRRHIPLMECRDEGGTSVTGVTKMVGANVQRFTLVFPEDWFADQEEIVGNLNEQYIFRVIGDGRPEGTNFAYTVELMGGNTAGCPSERLQPGEKFSVEYALVEEELSRKAGDIRFSAPTSMRNEWSTIRIQHKVPGSMLNQKLAVGIPVVDRKTGEKTVKDMWMHVVDWKVEVQFDEYKSNLLMYGRSNRNSNGEYMNYGKSGNVIKSGAGLREQMEYGNVMYYNDFSLANFEDALFELSESTLEYKDRYFIVKTGERGAVQFHKAVRDEVSGWREIVISDNNPSVVNKVSSELHSNALIAGFQFTEFLAPNNIHVKIEVDPLYDDKVRNKILHPKGGVAESYRYDIMSIGTMDQPNIFKCKIRGQEEYRGYQWGPFRNPFTGQTGNPYASFDEDAAVIHKMATLGVCVLDSTRTLSYIPAILG